MTALKPFGLTLGCLALATASALGIARAASERADCPGKVTCPATSEIFCRDQRPTIDPNRADCPGQIECPITGELVCADHCPVDQQDSAITPSCPSCCKK